MQHIRAYFPFIFLGCGILCILAAKFRWTEFYYNSKYAGNIDEETARNRTMKIGIILTVLGALRIVLGIVLSMVLF